MRPRQIDPGLIHELQVGFVDQRGGLKRVPVRLSAEELGRQVSQLSIDGRKEPIDRGAIPRFEVPQKIGYL